MTPCSASCRSYLAEGRRELLTWSVSMLPRPPLGISNGCTTDLGKVGPRGLWSDRRGAVMLNRRHRRKVLWSWANHRSRLCRRSYPELCFWSYIELVLGNSLGMRPVCNLLV